MNAQDIENRDMTDLMRGYAQDERGFVCLECEDTGANEDLRRHWQESHSEDEKKRFFSLLNADSILDLSYLEKIVYYRFYLGMANNDISKELDIPASTVRTLSRNFFEQYKKSKMILQLGEMLYHGNPVKRQYSKKQLPEEQIPGLDSMHGNVIGFFTKNDLHDEDHPIPHETTLILVSKRGSDKNWRFLMANKASKLMTLTSDMSKVALLKWDFLGGHIEQIDGDGGELQEGVKIVIGKQLPFEVHKNAAVRELKEELRIKGAQLNPKNLVYFYVSQYDGPTYPIGRNIEMTTVYLYILPDDIRDNNLLVRDVWTDSLGETVKKEFPSRFMTWEELKELNNREETAFMDGAKRVLDDFKKDPRLEQSLFALLNNHEHEAHLI
jgi:8-oxo-dGTP pyrophosphatase MutT (NUDIX family)